MPKKPTHFDQKPRRKAEFINPPNRLKEKVGIGGLGEEIIRRAQILLEHNTTDFVPLAELYLHSLSNGIEAARASDELIEQKENEALISSMLYPAVQLKANGGMFRYMLVTTVADRLVHFLEVIESPDTDALEIVIAFNSTLRAIVMGRITGDGGSHGRDLVDALDDACRRYFSRHPEHHEAEEYEHNYSGEF